MLRTSLHRRHEIGNEAYRQAKITSRRSVRGENTTLLQYARSVDENSLSIFDLVVLIHICHFARCAVRTKECEARRISSTSSWRPSIAPQSLHRSGCGRAASGGRKLAATATTAVINKATHPSVSGSDPLTP